MIAPFYHVEATTTARVQLVQALHSKARAGKQQSHGWFDPEVVDREISSPKSRQKSRLTDRESIEASIPEERSQRGPGGIFASVRGLPQPCTTGELEELAEVRQFLVVHRFSAPFTALVGGTEVKVDAMAADAEVSATGGAGFATSRLGRGIPFPTALVAVACHAERMTAWAKKKREAGLSAGL